MAYRRADKRRFIGSARVRIGHKSYKIELADGEEYGGASGTYRLRIGRKWFSHQYGVPFFVDKDGLAKLISDFLFNEFPVDTRVPEDIPYKTRVVVQYWHQGMPHTESTYTTSPVFKAFDGKNHVFVLTYHAGMIAVPCESLVVQ